MTRLGKMFLRHAPKAQPIREKVDKLDIIKFNHICSLKVTIKRMKMLQTGRRYLQIAHGAIDLYP